MKNAVLRAATAVIVGFLTIPLQRAVPSIHRLLGYGPGFFLLMTSVAWWLLPKFIPILASSPRDGQPLSVRDDGEWTVIEARPSPQPKRTVVVGLFIGGLVVSVMTVLGREPLLLSVPIGLAAAGALILFSRQATDGPKGRQVQRAPFAVRPDAVRLPNGEVIPTDQIYTFASVNTQDRKLYLVMGGNTIQQGSALAVQATHNRMPGISWAVVVDHHGTRSTLAGGLKKELANAVMAEITRRVGGFTLK